MQIPVGNREDRRFHIDQAHMNIMLVMADQMAPAALPIYGHPLTRTPTLSGLADRGVVFESAYCNSPLCSPSRAAFMSGRLPSKTGTYDNAAEFRSDIPTFAHYLRRAGYRMILSGKMHFCGPDQLHGFEERLTTDIYPADFGWTPDWDHPLDRPNWYHNMSSVTDAGSCVRTNQIDYDDEVVFAAERAIYDHARGSRERPFCMVVSLTHPHDPFAIPERWWNLYRQDEIDLPRFPLGTLPFTPHEKRLWHVCDMGGLEITEDHIRSARRAYYGAISYVDDNIGRLMSALRVTGLDDETIVIVTSDHGEMLGERGFWYKMSFFEGAVRVPLIVSAPSLFAARRVAASVSLIDLLPTLVELGQEGRTGSYASMIEGRSLMPHLTGSGGHNEVLGEYLAEGAIAPIVMIRRGPWKYIHSPADPDQLYDLAADPHEERNLADDPSGRGVADGFRQEVASRWGLEGLDHAVRESQRRRHAIVSALSLGVPAPWDFQPRYDASRAYIRNQVDLNELEARARYPRVRTSAPDQS